MDTLFCFSSVLFIVDVKYFVNKLVVCDCPKKDEQARGVITKSEKEEEEPAEDEEE